jgi:hypothetical protein
MKILKKLFTEKEAELFLHLDFLTMKSAVAWQKLRHYT